MVRPTQIDSWNFIAGKDSYQWGNGYGIEFTPEGIAAFVANRPDQRVKGVRPNKTLVLSAIKDNASLRMWIDGIHRSTHTNLSSYNPGLYEYRLGNADTQSGSWGLTGHIGEFLHYNRAVDDDERQHVQAYLMKKWQNSPQ
ncbi:MAG: hypothetical protein O2856_10380 [Planctomycetota bacterium]|nr:hypothetical protein [Planctomycetota bacterium]